MFVESKKVSIVMCTYNGEKFLREQLESIIAQTYPVFELIIQDDGSTDGTFSLLKEYEELYPFIRAYRNERQKGINDNFFSAMERASGDFIAIADQDDIWEKDKIERQVATIGDCILSGGISRPFTDGDIAVAHYDTRPPNIYLERIIYTSMIAGHTMLFRRELLGMIPDKDRQSSIFVYDHLIQMVAAAYESIYYCPHVLVHQRRHVASATYIAPNNYSRNIKNIFSSAARTLKLRRKLKKEMKEWFAKIFELLDSLPVDTCSKRNAIQLALLHASSKKTDSIRLSYVCVKLRDKIFHTKEKRRLIAVLRALYFPVSCSDYFRYLDKN